MQWPHAQVAWVYEAILCMLNMGPFMGIAFGSDRWWVAIRGIKIRYYCPCKLSRQSSDHRVRTRDIVGYAPCTSVNLCNLHLVMCINQSHRILELEWTLGIPYCNTVLYMAYLLEHVQSSIVGYEYD